MNHEPSNGPAPAGPAGEPSPDLLVVPPPATPGVVAVDRAETNPSVPGNGEPTKAVTRSETKSGWRLDWRVPSVGLLGLIAFVVWRSVTGHAKPDAASASLKLPSVAVAPTARADLYNEVSFKAEFRPYLEVELHAKVSGYVDQMNVDFGDQVKAGQLLARLDAPDIVAELNNALATERRAEADYTNAHQIYQRMFNVNQQHPDLVAQQDVDTAAAKDQAAAAAIAAAKADVDKYQTLVNYTRIFAPFDGVITRRYADPGALIQAGTASETQSLPLVRVSDNYRLRLDFPVDQPYVKDVHVGDPVEVRVESLEGKRFTAKITRVTLKVEESTRTMLTEIEVQNPTLEIVPGMYAFVVLKVQNRPHVISIPIEAVPPGTTNSVYVVDRGGAVEDRPVVLGLETPTHFEVVSGLNEGELVLLGSRAQLVPGQKVEAKVVETPTEQ